MKRSAVWAVLLMGIIVALGSCYEDIIKPELITNADGPPQPVSFKKELAPLFNANCALSGCHVAGGHKPYLTLDVSYQQIVNGGFVNTDFPKESILYKMVYGDMAQYISSASDRQKVYDWIRNGAPNN